MSTKVLSESALEKLVALGSPIRYENGWRSISCASYMCGSSNDSGATIELPDELDSVETLQFLGFTITAASTIWQRFVNAEEDYPARELLKFARTYVRAGNNAYDEGDDWSAALDSMGATEKLRGRILTPGHEDVRLSRTARALSLIHI